MATPTAADLGLEAVRLVASVLYILAGSLVLRRRVKAESRLAQYAFVTWWFGLAYIGFLSMPAGIGFNVADHGLTAVRVFAYLLFAGIFVAIAGLVYYLLYLYTGRAGLWRPVALTYAAMMLLVVYLVEGFGPFIQMDPDGTTTVGYETPHPSWVQTAFSLALITPPFVATLAYSLLYFRLKTPLQRYRVALVSLGIGMWFGYSLLNTVLRFVTGRESQTFAELLGAQILGLVAALLILVAYHPPEAVSRRLATPLRNDL